MGVLLKSQFRIGYTNGGELVTSTGSNYRGPYINTIQGALYIGDSAQNKGARLFPISERRQIGDITNKTYDLLKPKISQNAQKRSPVATKPSPTDFDRKKGMFIRYFFIDLRTYTWSETSKREYDKRATLDPYIYRFEKIGWWINELYQNRNAKSILFLQTLGNIDLNPYEYEDAGDSGVDLTEDFTY